MTEEEWLKCEAPFVLVGFLQQIDFSERKARWYCAACCRLIEQQTPDWPAASQIPLLDQLAESGVTLSVPVHVESGLGGSPYKLWSGPPPWACEDAVLRTSLGTMASPTRESGHEDEIENMTRMSGLPGVVATMEWALRAEPTQSATTLTTLLRDIFGNPFRSVAFDPEWQTLTVVALANHMYESRDFSAMPILADALQDAGCENEDVLSHCRGPGPHVRGCWVVDMVLGKA